MQFTRLISTFLVLLTFGVFAFASPAAKRSDASVMTILTNLKTTLAPTLTAINATNTQGTNGAAVIPMISKVMTDLNNAHTQLELAGLGLKRQAADSAAIAALAAEIIAEITVTVNTVATLPFIAVLLPGLDAALNLVLTELGVLVTGVLVLVSVLLVDVSALLDSIGLGLVLGLLGL